MKHTKDLGTKSIGKLLLEYSIPAIISMTVNSIYNIVDRIFIGKHVSEAALAGLTIAFPLMMTIFAFASLIGIGGAALISIRLGEKDNDGATQVFGSTVSFGIIATLLISTLIYFNISPILTIFGADINVMDYAQDYLRIIILGYVFHMTSFILNNTVRTEGQPVLSMTAMISSAVMNIILDYIFIIRLNWGVQGAALATIAGQFTGLCILLSFYLRGKSVLKFNLKSFIPQLKLLVKIVSIGFATFLSTIGRSISVTFLNRALALYGGTMAITSMGAINSLMTLFIMPLFGIMQGMRPIMGYNYGARQPKRVYKTLKLGILVSVLFSSSAFVLLQFIPKTFISMFINQGSDTFAMAIQGLRLNILMLPLISINLIGVTFFQSIAKGNISTLLGMLRHFILLLPIVFILPGILGLTGVWLSPPIADFFAIVITGAVMYQFYKKDKLRYTSDMLEE